MKYIESNNTFIQQARNDPKNRLEVEVGDVKQPEFYPQVKLKFWDNEINFSVRLIDSEEEQPLISLLDSDVIQYKKNKKEIKFYDLPISSAYPEGGYEFEVTLKEKPLTNIVSFTLRTKGLESFYQPELEDEEVSEMAIRENISLLEAKRRCRPENVVGSYAVYYKDCPVNLTDGKMYKTGKAFHVFRPKIVDANGSWVWGDIYLDLDKDALSVTIPQEFLDNATYPVTHAAGLTLGYTSAGATTEPSDVAYKLLGSKFALSNSASVSSITAYVGKGNATYYNQFKCAVYNTSLNLLGETEIIVPSPHDATFIWQTFNFSSNVELTPSDYWISNWATGYNGSPNYRYGSRKYDTGTSNQGLYKNQGDTLNFPNPLVSPAYDDKMYSIYFTYTTGSTIPTTFQTDAVRNVTAQLSANLDTARNIMTQLTANFQADTIRKSVNSISLPSDSKRIILSSPSVLVDSLRQIQKAITTDTVAFNALEDTYANSSTVLGNYEDIWMETNGTGNPTRILYIKFDISSIPSSKYINYGQLVLWGYDYTMPASGSITVDAFMVTQTWSESTLVWANKPTYDPTPISSTVITLGPASDTYEIGGAVQKWVNGTAPNYGICLIARPQGEYEALGYYSSEYVAYPTKRPKLTVNYSSVASAASLIVDSSRKLKGLITNRPDALRNVQRNNSSSQDISRNVTTTQSVLNDSHRKVISLANVSADLQRILQSTITTLADTARNITTIPPTIFNLDTYRKIVNNQNVQGDSNRSLSKVITLVVDTLRFVTDKSQEIVMVDVARIVQVSQNVTSQTKRITRITTQALSDNLRSLLNLISFENESKRSVELSDEVIHDSERKPTVDISIEPETSRKLAGAIEHVFDSLRNIVNILVKKGPTYILKDVKSIFYFKELEDKYSFKEITQAYVLKELPESYGWKGLNSMYQFRLGEEKEVGVEVLAKDSTSYALSAQWEFEGESGSANIDNHKVFTVIEPKSTGSKKCIFTVTVMPAGTSVEQTLICPVMVNVTSS